jgi:hypothetical protein
MHVETFEEKQQHLQEVLDEFFEWYNPETFKEALMHLLFCAFDSDEADGWDRMERGRCINLFMQTVQLVEAVRILQTRRPAQAA